MSVARFNVLFFPRSGHFSHAEYQSCEHQVDVPEERQHTASDGQKPTMSALEDQPCTSSNLSGRPSASLFETNLLLQSLGLFAISQPFATWRAWLIPLVQQWLSFHDPGRRPLI